MKLGMINEEQGSFTTLYCATDDACKGENGLYYEHRKVKEPLAVSKDQKLVDELWNQCMTLIKDYIQ